jgi:hypothetical protein
MAFGLGTPQAEADLASNLSDVVFEIQVSSALGEASFVVTQADGLFVGDTMFFWPPEPPLEPFDLIDPNNNNVIASLDGGNAFYMGDPQIGQGWAVVAGEAETTITITSGLLSFPTLDGAEGLVSAGLTLTDNDGDGATLAGIGGTIGTYVTNGQAPGGDVFITLTGTLEVDMPGDTVDASADTGGFIPVGDSIMSMSQQYTFTLSPNDGASLTSNYVIIPAPAALPALAAGLLLGRRRRRRA